MSPHWFRAVVVTLIQLVLVFGQHSVGADFSDNCDDSTNSLSCIRTYDELYNSLAKSQNSFDIEAALYPARRPSSVRVFVNLHGRPNKAENPMARYTWSLSCLYVAVPPLVLEVLSLGSILVTPRTQALNITIPYFCCNVSKKEDERKKTIKETIKRALSALQDLAISPGIRDPRLNTAECVIEGHRIDVAATGRSVYIKIILWCSFLFTLAVFRMLTSFIKYCRLEGWSETTITENPNTTSRNMKNIRMKNTAKSIFYLGVLLSFLGFSQQLVLLLLLVNFYMDEALIILDIVPILVSLWFAMAFNQITGLISHIRSVFENYFSWLKSPNTSTDLANGEEGMICPWWGCFPKLVAFTCAATTSFCSCWMLIGIMLNPTWGLTVTLVICFTFASFTYAVYEYLTLVSCKQEKVKPDKLYALLPGLLGFLAVIFLVPVIVFAGQSFNGKETADETLKTILMTALGSFISWLSWKRLLNKSQKSEEKQSQCCDSKLLAGNSETSVFADEELQLASRGSSSHSTPGQRSLKADSLTKITDDYTREPESFRPPTNRAQGRATPTRGFGTETFVLSQPVYSSPSADHIPQQANPSGESVVEIVVDGTNPSASEYSSAQKILSQATQVVDSATKIILDGINQPSSNCPSDYITGHVLDAMHSGTEIVVSDVHQPPTSEMSSDHTPGCQHPEQTTTETQTSIEAFDDQNQKLSEDGPIIGLDEDHPTSNVTSSFHSPGYPPSDLTGNDHITEESQSSSDGSFIDKSQEVHPLVGNGENIESVYEKKRETEITRESNV